jgi:hypothetical protein
MMKGILRRTPDEEPKTAILAQSIESRVHSVRALSHPSPEMSSQSDEDEEREDLEC